MHAITERQQDLLDAIERHTEQYGRAPTIRELCRTLGVSSSCTVQKAVEALIAKGALRRVPHTARSLRVVNGRVNLAQCCAHCRGWQKCGKAGSQLVAICGDFEWRS